MIVNNIICITLSLVNEIFCRRIEKKSYLYVIYLSVNDREYLNVAWQGFTVVESLKAGIRGHPFSEHTSCDNTPE